MHDFIYVHLKIHLFFEKKKTNFYLHSIKNHISIFFYRRCESLLIISSVGERDDSAIWRRVRVGALGYDDVSALGIFGLLQSSGLLPLDSIRCLVTG